MNGQRVVIDACAALNLLATGRIVEIVRAVEFVLIIPSQAKADIGFLEGPPDDNGIPTKVRADLGPIEVAGLLEVPAQESLDSRAFVSAASHMIDADAAAVALAGVLRAPLLSDDGKIRHIARRLFPGCELISTLQVIRRAAACLGLGDAEVKMLLQGLRSRGQFVPSKNEPELEWYLLNTQI